MHVWNFASCSLNSGNQVGCVSFDPGFVEWIPTEQARKDIRIIRNKTMKDVQRVRTGLARLISTPGHGGSALEVASGPGKC